MIRDRMGNMFSSERQIPDYGTLFLIKDGKTPHMMTFSGGGFLGINPVSFNSFGFQEYFAFDADGINRAPDD